MAESARSPAYFAIIPANVRYHTALSPNAKLLYGEITALADQTGYCWASNKYLAERFLWGERTVSRLIAQMQELELITIEMVPVKNGRERRIFVGQTVAGGLAKIGDQNNKEEYIPPLPPKGDTREGNSRKRKAHKWQADWKAERFEAFWTYYRTHVRPENRQAAIRAWDRLQPDDELIARIGRALQKQLQTQAWKDGIGIPYASTYLDNARWEDAEGLPDPPAETVPKEAYGWQQ